MTRRLVVLLLLPLTLVIPAALCAQEVPSRWQGEARVDALIARVTALHGSAGLSARLGSYVRAGLIAGAGVARTGEELAFDARIDGVGRFLFDPYRQHRRAPYAFGGASARWSGERWGAFLVLGVGVEGPRVRGFLPAIEAGVGGGVRLSIVARAAPSEGR